MNVDKMLKGVYDTLAVKRVYGDPIEHDGVVVVPAAAVRGGGGGGGDERHNGGGGFGVVAKPVGVYVIQDGDVTWKPALDPNRIALGGQALAALGIVLAYRLLRRSR